MRRISLSPLVGISVAALLAMAVPLVVVGPAFAFPQAFYRTPTGPKQVVSGTPSAAATTVGGTDGPAPASDPSKAPNPGSQTPTPAPKPVTKCVTKRRTKTCRVYLGTQLLRSCTTKGKNGHRVKTCRIYDQAGKLASICTTKLHRKVRCHRVKTIKAQAATLQEEGWNTDVIPQMVRFYRDGEGWCSGTLITRGWILTAGHCLHDGDRGGTYLSPGRLQVVPGNSASNGVRTTPYGKYQVRRVLVSDGWENGQFGQDWGMAEVYPNGSGYYPGDYTGTYSATWNSAVRQGQLLARTGYPAEKPFSDPYYGGGEYQYHCNHYWSGTLWMDGSSYGLYDDPCHANGGSSGGPVFWYDGTRWTIIGVNNLGERDPITNWGKWSVSFWFDSYFGQFWNKVQGRWTD